MKKILPFIVLLIALGIMLPGMSGFPYPVGSNYSDLSISHYPNAIYLLNSIREFAQIPLWSETILCGYPFAANPLSGLWYPLGWVAYLFPLPFGFNLLSMLHLWLAGCGMYVLLKGMGRSDYAALAGAVCLELSPRLFAHLGAGHLTFLYAICWTPWLFAVEMKQGDSLRGRAWIGLLLGMMALADLRWTAYAGLAWLFYFLSLRWRTLWNQRTLLQVGVSLILAGMIAAPLLLPLLEYIPLTTRQFLTPKDNLVYSFPPVHLFGLVVPDMMGIPEWLAYPGAFALFAVIWIFAIRPFRKDNGYWLVLFLVSLLFSLGSYLPGSEFIAQLPGFSLLRVPSRALVLMIFSSAALVSYGVDMLANRPWWAEKLVFPDPTIYLVLITGFITMATAGVWILGSALPIEFFWGALSCLISLLMILIRRFTPLRPAYWQIILIGLLVLDLGGTSVTEFQYQPKDKVLAENQTAISSLDDDHAEFFRVYSPSYSVPQQVAVREGIQLADGIDPMQLSEYTRFMAGASGVPQKGYSVTLPPFATGNPENDNQLAEIDARKLGLLNVRYVVSAFPIKAAGLEERRISGQTYIYENQFFKPRSWVQLSGSPVGEDIQSTPEMDMRPNTIQIKATGPGKLVLSELVYPGWRATLDGVSVNIDAAEGLFRSIELPAGEHQITFSFVPVSVFGGMGIGVLAYILTGLLLLRGNHHG